MRKPLLFILAFTTLLAAACTDGQARYGAPADEPARQVDIGAALGVSDLSIVGVTVEPTSERVLLLDANRGIYELTDEGAVTLVWANETERYGVFTGTPWTDLVALEDGVFALTTLSDGYLLNLGEDTLIQHFCYEPGWEEEPPLEPAVAQITDAVAYDAQNDLIYAQPRTVTDNLVDVLDSNLALYDRTTGADLNWVQFDVDYHAGAMAMEDQDNILLAVGSRIDRYTNGPNTTRFAMDLRSHGVTDIQGMAIHPRSGNLLVVDGATQTLFEIER